MAARNKHTFQCSDIPKRSFKYFEALKNKKQLCDITLQIGSESISAHRIIITAVIPYFRDILEQDKKDISMPNVEPNALKCLIEFAYTCEVKIDAENVRNLLVAACHLGVDVVRDACSDFLDDCFEYDNVFTIRKLAESLNCARLLKYTDCYIKRNFENVSQTKEFLQCPSTYLKELIGNDDIKVKTEKKVMEAVLRWAKSSPKERSADLPELMCKVRMPLLEPLYLTKITEQEMIIKSSLLCRDLIDEARNRALFPELRKGKCNFVIEPRKSIKPRKTSDSNNQNICVLQGEKKFIALHYNSAEKKWRTDDSCCFFLNGGSSAVMRKKIYFFCGSSEKEYDPEKNYFRNLNPMPTARCYATAVALKNHIYVCGGRLGLVPTNVVELFDPEKNEWKTACPMHIPCSGSSSVALDEYIFVLGGRGQYSLYNTVQRYDSVINKWQNMPPLCVKRCQASAAILNGKIYICGGYVTSTKASVIASSTAEMYDPAENKSRVISPMTTARRDLSLLSCRGKLYALGGFDQDKNAVKGIDIYDAESGKWTWEATGHEFRVSGAAVL